MYPQLTREPGAIATAASIAANAITAIVRFITQHTRNESITGITRTLIS